MYESHRFECVRFGIIFVLSVFMVINSLVPIYAENPLWFENVETWYQQNKISEIEYHNAVKYLMTNRIIETESSDSKILAIYGILDEEQNWNIISSSIDGNDKKVITTFDFTGLEGYRPIHALDVILSPDGKYFLYSFPKSQDDSLWLVDTDTKEKKLIVKKTDNQILSEYYWSPDSKKITYSLLDIPPPCPQCGMPLYQIFGPWYIYDVENDTHEIIREKTRSLVLMGWWNDNELVFNKFEIPYETIPLEIYDIHSKKSDHLKDLDRLPTAIINANEKTVLITSHTISNTCDILIINSETETSYHIQENNVACPSNYNPNFWISNMDFKMIYGVGSSPSGGPIGWPDVDDNGVYLISSIYLMDLENQRKEPIFVGKTNGPYFLLGGWNSQHDVLAYIEWQKNDIETHSLMISNSEGLSSIKIDETRREVSDNRKEIPFYGWKIIE